MDPPSYLRGVRTNGSVACWGFNGAGQATSPAGTFTAVSGGGLHLSVRASARHPRA